MGWQPMPCPRIQTWLDTNWILDFLKASMLRANQLKRVSDLAIFGSEYWFLFSIPVHDDSHFIDYIPRLIVASLVRQRKLWKEMLSKQFQAAHPVHLQKTNLALVPILDIVLLSVSKNKGQFTSCAPFRLRKPAPEGPEWPEPPWNQGFWQGSWWELSRDFISLQPCLANPFELLFNVLHLQPKHWPVSGAAMEQSWKIWYIWAWVKIQDRVAQTFWSA